MKTWLERRKDLAFPVLYYLFSAEVKRASTWDLFLHWRLALLECMSISIGQELGGKLDTELL